MFRSLPKSLVFVALLALLAIGFKPLDAATYNIGAGAPGGANSYANLQALYNAHPTLNNDTLVFYDAVDASWTSRSYFTVMGTLNLRSSVTGEERIISGNDVGGRIFYFGGTTVNIGPEFVFEHIDSAVSGTMSLHGNSTVLNIEGVTYRNNFSALYGGAIDTYGGTTQWINARGADFLDNIGYRGGGVELYYMKGGDFTNANFINNTATDEPGGAIIVLLASYIPAEVILGATDGQTSTFSGNAYTGYGYSLANSLYVTYDGTVDVKIVTEGNGVLDLIDPIYLTPDDGYGYRYSYTANFTKTGTGTWKMGGNTQINTGDGQSTIAIQEGMLFMYSGAQINMTGANDSFSVARNAQVLVSGDNTIAGTSVLFSPGSNLVFDMDFYLAGLGHDPGDPMLNLSGDTLVVQGTRIDVANVPFGQVPAGRYALIQGTSPLTVGDFDLWVGNVLVNDVSKRYGYRLNYDDPLQLALLVTDTYNRVLTWRNYTGNNRWDFGDANKNWDVPNYTEPIDSFIPGDAVVFNLSGDHTVMLNTSMPFSQIGSEPGMRITGSGNWTFSGGALSDMYNPGVFDVKGALVHDGTGTVTLQTDAPSTYHGGTVISGGGELIVSRSDQLGYGGIAFQNNLDNRLTFNATTTLDKQLTVGGGTRGTLSASRTLTVRVADSPAVSVAANGNLALEGTIRFTGNQSALVVNGTVSANGTQFENNGGVAAPGAVQLAGNGKFDGSSLRFSGNTTTLSGAAFHQLGNSTATIQNSEFIANKSQSGGAVFVEAGKFTAGSTLFERNEAEFGGALAVSGGTVNLQDSNFLDNKASTSGGAIYYEALAGSSLTLGATNGKTSTFSGNKVGTEANSVTFSGTAANIQVITEGTGVLDMLDPMSGQAGSITKTGAGTWKLGGNSEFSGNTQFNVNGGKLALYEDATIDIASGTFAIGVGGTLVAQGGNEVTVQTISLANGATIGFDLTDYNPGNIPLLDLAAISWNVNGWHQNIDVTSFEGLKNGAVYNLMTVDGTSLAGAENTLTLLYRGEAVSAMRTMSGELTVAGSTLQVVIDDVPEPLNGITKWTNGTGNGEWNATSLNWTGLAGGDKDLTNTKQFYHGDAVIFDGTGAGTVTINAGGVIIAPQGNNPGMWVSGGNNYTFSGGVIDGSGGLLKEGSGTVTFANENKFTGGTEIQGGTVVAQTVKSLGTGHVINHGVLEFDLDEKNSGIFGIIYKLDKNGKYELDEDGKPIVDYEQLITGAGSVAKSGDGNLTLNNPNNDYRGGTTILGGNLIATDVRAIGQDNDRGDIITGTGDAKGTMVFDLRTTDGEIAQTISGTGSVAKSGSKTLILSGNNSYTGKTLIEEGRLTVTGLNALGSSSIVNSGELEFNLNAIDELLDRPIDGNGTVIKSGTMKLSIADELTLQNSTLFMADGTFGFETLTQVTLGGLAGTANLDLTNDRGQSVALTVGNNGQDAEYSGILSGKDASVTKIGSGTQTLSGKNTYSGGTVVEEGRLVAVGLDALGDRSAPIKTNAELELQIDSSDSLDRVITGIGSVEKSGKGTLEIDVSQKYTGGTIVSGGTLKAASFDMLGTGPISVRSGTLSVDVAKDMELASNVSVVGNGILEKSGSGILTITGTPSLTGTLDIIGGGLIVNGVSKAATIMGKDTMLAGNGRIDNTVTLKAGASQYVGLPGSTVQNAFTAGNFVYEGGSTVYVKVGQYGADQIIAGNGFDFAKGGGTVNVVFLSLDDFDEGQTAQYDVFTALGGVFTLNGTLIDNHSKDSSVLQLDGVQGKVQFLTDDGLAFVGYDVAAGNQQRTLGVTLLATGGNVYSYLTENQRKVLGAAGNFTVLDRFFNTTKEYRGSLLNELTPSLQTAMPYISQRAVTQYNLATFERLRFLREPLGLDADQESNYRGSSYRLMHRHGQQNYIWFQNFGDFLRTQADAHCSGLYADGYGFSVGVDRGIDAHTVAGVGLGGYFAKARTSDSLQNGKANSFLLSAYGMRTSDDDWTLSGSGGFSFNRYEIDRNAPSFGTALHSGHNGTAVYAAAELTRKFMLNKLEVSPFLDVTWICLWEEGATERASGDPSLALRIKSQNMSSFLVTPGVRFGRSFRMLEKNIVNPSVYLGWIQDWGAGRIRTTAAFPDEPNFTIRGASMRNNRAIVGLNLNMTLNNRADLFARFNSELAENYSDLSMHWGIRLGF